ncbi:alanine racemase [Microbacterium sp. X-17]|uniref:alanine racemase n=1 Tax=Microbacterium sp. X-17 TaxID=3144404 RepID=UPI0031F54925
MTLALHVDLDVFSRNLARIRGILGDTEHLLVVKDDAYGHGLGPIVRRAWMEGVRWFGAFDLATGLAVRHALPDGGSAFARVFVWMLGSRAEAKAAAKAALDIGVGDPELLEDVAAVGHGVRVHLKIDTGLHRNGVRPEHWAAFVERAVAHERAGSIRIEGVWSHLAEASDEEDDTARAAFEAAADELDAVLGRHALRHLSASAASFARPEFRFDLARVGAFAYGIRPAGGPDQSQLRIRPIGRLEADVVERRGDAVVVPVGSLHGLPSTLGAFEVATERGPHVLGPLGETESLIRSDVLRIGDHVVIYGTADAGGASATDLAERIGTVGEEIAVRISPLVPRVYSGVRPLR